MTCQKINVRRDLKELKIAARIWENAVGNRKGKLKIQPVKFYGRSNGIPRTKLSASAYNNYGQEFDIRLH